MYRFKHEVFLGIDVFFIFLFCPHDLSARIYILLLDKTYKTYLDYQKALTVTPQIRGVR